MKKLIFAFLLPFYSMLCFSQSSVVGITATLLEEEIPSARDFSALIELIPNVVDGSSVYSETHNGSTNEYGVATFYLGTGENKQGNLDAIKWGTNPYWAHISWTIDDGTILEMTELIGAVPLAISVPDNTITSDQLDMNQLYKERKEWIANIFEDALTNGNGEPWEGSFTDYVIETTKNTYVNKGEVNSVGTDMITDEFRGWLFDGFLETDEGIDVDPDGNVTIGVGSPPSPTETTLTVHHPDNAYGGTFYAVNTAGKFVVPTKSGSTSGVMAEVDSPDGKAFTGFNIYNGAWGNMGSEYGVSGGINGTGGFFGLDNYGAGAYHDNGNYGYMATQNYGVYGANYLGPWGFLGGPTSAVYGSNNGDASFWAAFFEGDGSFTGTLYKGGGAFRIDHPLDPANKYLNHSFVESPDMKNIYDGVVILDNNGEAVVILPEWFEALNKDFRYQLTCIGGYANIYIAEKVQNNQFRIDGGSPGLEVSWQVTGIRKDAYANDNRIEVEVLKDGDEVGKYLHPEVFGVSKKSGIVYDDRQKLDKKGLDR